MRLAGFASFLDVGPGLGSSMPSQRLQFWIQGETPQRMTFEDVLVTGDEEASAGKWKAKLTERLRRSQVSLDAKQLRCLAKEPPPHAKCRSAGSRCLALSWRISVLWPRRQRAWS